MLHARARVASVVRVVSFVVGVSVVVVGSVMSAACAPAPAPVQTCPQTDDRRASCANDRECAGGFCEKGSADDACGVCFTFVCRRDEDCTAGNACDAVRGHCESLDACDVLAPGDGCDDGALCAPVDEESRCTVPVATACEIVPRTVVGDGPAVALFLDDAGRPLPIFVDVTRSADAVSAADGDVTCSAPLIALPALAPDEVRVVVRDFDTGDLLAGADVEVDGAAAVAVDGTVTVTDGGGGTSGGDGPALVRASMAGYGSVALVRPGARDVEVLLPRVVDTGDVAGALFVPDFDVVAPLGDVHVGLGSLSAPNLVDALTPAALIGVNVTSNVKFEGITAPEGQDLPRPTGGVVGLGPTTMIFARGLAVGAPGTRLLSMNGSSVALATLGGAFSDFANTPDDERAPFDFMLTLWQAAERNTSFDLVGTVQASAAPLPVRDAEELDAFGEEHVARPAIDASGDVDVAVGHLLPGDDAAWLALYAIVPGRGAVLASLRFVEDTDADGFVDSATADGVSGAPGLVRLYVAPTLWLAGRTFVVVAGSTTSDRQRQGHLSTERASAVVTDRRVALPPFPSEGAALVDGSRVTVPPRHGELVAVDGRKNDAPARVYLGPDATDADTGLDRIDRVWSVTSSAPVTAAAFAPGSVAVAHVLLTPTTTRALFGGE